MSPNEGGNLAIQLPASLEEARDVRCGGGLRTGKTVRDRRSCCGYIARLYLG
jgi:hypothetical protein